jgi:hypothetical protein
MTPRTPLAQIDVNSRHGKELTPYIRGKVAAEYDLGQSFAAIGRRYVISESTIRYTIKLESTRQNGHSIDRNRKPWIISAINMRQILRTIKHDPFTTFIKIGATISSPACGKTLLKIICESGYNHWESQKKIKHCLQYAV